MILITFLIIITWIFVARKEIGQMFKSNDDDDEIRNHQFRTKNEKKKEPKWLFAQGAAHIKWMAMNDHANAVDCGYPIYFTRDHNKEMGKINEYLNYIAA